MKILITGASGFLGRKLLSVLSKNYTVSGTSFSQTEKGLYHLDVASKDEVDGLLSKLSPDIVVHNAAYVDVDLCEEKKDIAKRINVGGTQNVVNWCKSNNSKMIYISTDSVFDGKNPPYSEKSKAISVNYYGKTKLLGEKIVSSNLKEYLIIRPAVLYGYNSPDDRATFVVNTIKKLKNNEKVYANTKKLRYPTLSDDVANGINILIEKNCRGIYHLGNNECVTMYEFALRIAKIFNLSADNVIGKEKTDKAPRPLNPGLDSSKMKKLGFQFTSLDEGLRLMKKQMNLQ